MRAVAWIPCAALVAACSPAPPSPAPVPVVAPATPGAGPAPDGAIPLPPMPRVTGPLALRVVYPPDGAPLPARDSTFIFGSTGTGDATLLINAAPVFVHPNGAFLGWLPTPRGDARWVVRARTATDSATVVRTLRRPAPPRPPAPVPAAPIADTLRLPRLGVLRNGYPEAVADTDQVTIARPVAGGTYGWLLRPGTVVPVLALRNGEARVRLDSQLEAWVDTASVRLLADAGGEPPRRVVGNARIRAARDWVDLILPVGSIPPYRVEDAGDALLLTLYGTTANIDVLSHGPDDGPIAAVTWEAVATDRTRVRVRLAHPALGYLVLADRGALVLRIRRAPRVDAAHPLRGRRIVVDAGHPPIGSTGPTGLTEPEATLAIARQLEAELVRRGATVVMTRTDMRPVGLTERTVMARRADGDALVSIHLNALPDGVEPYGAQGTGTYYFHPQALPLAREIQRGMVARMGLRDLGVYFDNLALARPTWMPAVLCEGAFIMIPEQEAALRTVAFQRAYALGVADGLERWFRTLATPAVQAVARP